jgi:hypothetical protein
MIYRGGKIWADAYVWSWYRVWNERGREGVVVWWHRPFPFCWRFRSDEEALNLLCERVDEYLDRSARLAALAAARQTQLQEREQVLTEMEREGL